MGSTFDIELRLEEGYRFTVDFGDGIPTLLVDEPPPLGEGAGPNPSRLLAAAVADAGRLDRCLDLFEDFCIVTQSVRNGFDVEVEVNPASSASSEGAGRRSA